MNEQNAKQTTPADQQERDRIAAEMLAALDALFPSEN
jgi:hypothetical protein